MTMMVKTLACVMKLRGSDGACAGGDVLMMLRVVIMGLCGGGPTNASSICAQREE